MPEESGFDSWQGRGSSLHNGHTGPGVHPVSSHCVPGTLYPGVKRPAREADHSPPSSAEVKNGGAIPPLPHVFLIKHRDDISGMLRLVVYRCFGGRYFLSGSFSKLRRQEKQKLFVGNIGKLLPYDNWTT
jgi:hypothetical protein